MADYFECLHCGALSPVLLTRPMCRECGCGTGIVRDRGPEEPAEPFDKLRTGSVAHNRKGEVTAVAPKRDR